MKIKIVLNLSKRSNAEVLVDADSYTTKMVDNPNFTAPEIKTQITTVQTAAADLRSSMNAPLSETKTDTVRRSRDVLDRSLTKLGNQVKDVANDPNVPDDMRITIAHSAGMAVKTATHPQKHVFEVRNGSTSGSVLLMAEGGVNANGWQYTTDLVGFTNRISVDPTTSAKVEIPNLEKGVKHAFFHKPIIAGEKTDWEGPIFWVVV